MSDNILSEEVQRFINQHLSEDVAQLALHQNPFPDVDWRLILQQIQSKQKCREKLPTWFATPMILYPTKISIEQSSSEILAKHKSQSITGKKLIDLTGGFGVDTFYFSKQFEQVVHVEINPELVEIVRHNNVCLGAKNIDVIQGDGLEILQNLNEQFDWIYIDPARRDNQQKKVFRLADCTPDVTNLMDEYFTFSDRILIKTAPLLDISQGIKELQFVEKIDIVSLNNEVRELLWYLNKNHKSEPELFVTDYDISGNKKTMKIPVSDDENVTYSLPKSFLYEPISGLLKSGCFNFISNKFKVEKLDRHTHLYTSVEPQDFWGRQFKIISCQPFSKKAVQFWANKKANISCRNFPMKPEEIRKKFKIKDGGEQYLFFTSAENGAKKLIIACEKFS